MQFTPRNRGSNFWRSDYQSPRRAERPPQSREWSSSWNSPKTYFTGRPKYQYRGPNARGYNKNGNSYWSGYNNQQSNNGYRDECPPGGGRGRGGWRKLSVNHNSKGYQNDHSHRWRSPPRRRLSPLRARENESPSPRRPSESPRRGDGSPHPSDAKRARLSRSAERSPRAAERSGKENAEQQQQQQQQLSGTGSRRFYGEPSGGSSGSRFAASQQMRPPPSPRKSGDGSKALQLYGGKAQSSRDLQLVPVIRPSDQDKHGKDPLYIGLPNYGNSCYQNATLQSLLGLRPFLNEMMSLISGLERGQCRTLSAVAKLMVLRQKVLSKSVSSHLNDLRDVFADIDPAFRGTEMQDANEFLLRLLDTMKDEVDARRPAANPVRDNFQYQTIESYMCTKCHETVLKRQENISWFVSVPRRQGTEAPTLQDALRLSMRPDRRELLCQHCRHDECRVTTKISQLPRTLILQLNRYVFLGEESKKIRANVGIPKFLSLNEYVADDVTRPPEWKCTKPSLCNLSDLEGPERPSAPSPPPAAASAPAPAAPARPPSPCPARPSSPRAAAEPGDAAVASAAVPLPLPAPPPPPPPPPAAAELVVLDADSDPKPTRTREDEDRELQEAIMRSLEEGESADSAAEQAHLSEFCVEDDQSLCSVDLAGDNTYRLVGVVSHYGGATHSGHYVSDVYSVDRDSWFHYDDRRVSCVDEADVLGDGRQRNGYIFFYLHKDLCGQVVGAEVAGGLP